MKKFLDNRDMKKHYYTDAILEICDHHHFTVDEIFQKIQEKFPEAGKSSIYRNVEQLAEKGDLTKILGIKKKAFFEKTKEPHAHFICQKSGKILDIPLSETGEFSLKNIQKKYNISQIKNIDIKIHGTLA